MNHTELKPWITAAPDGSVSDEQIKMLLDMSYDAAASKKSKGRGAVRSNQNGKPESTEGKR